MSWRETTFMAYSNSRQLMPYPRPRFAAYGRGVVACHSREWWRAFGRGHAADPSTLQASGSGVCSIAVLAFTRSTAPANAAVNPGPRFAAFEGRLSRVFPKLIRIKVKAMDRS